MKKLQEQQEQVNDEKVGNLITEIEKSIKFLNKIKDYKDALDEIDKTTETDTDEEMKLNKLQEHHGKLINIIGSLSKDDQKEFEKAESKFLNFNKLPFFASKYQ